MDINHIDLPPVSIAAMYGKTLVEAGLPSNGNRDIPPSSVKEPEKPLFNPVAEEIKGLGGNRRQILLLVNYPGLPFIPDAEQSFLTDILSACKLGWEDVILVNRANFPDADYKKLTTHFKSKIVLLFGVEPATTGLPLRFPHYQPQSFSGISYLYSPAAEELRDDKLQKSKLWVCLKRLFNLGT